VTALIDFLATTPVYSFLIKVKTSHKAADTLSSSRETKQFWKMYLNFYLSHASARQLILTEFSPDVVDTALLGERCPTVKGCGNP
jgi:hypothetical protein